MYRYPCIYYIILYAHKYLNITIETYILIIKPLNFYTLRHSMKKKRKNFHRRK